MDLWDTVEEIVEEEMDIFAELGAFQPMNYFSKANVAWVKPRLNRGEQQLSMSIRHR